MVKSKLKVKDKVMVLTGKDKGKVGTVKNLNEKNNQILVEQVNLVKRHVKGNPYTGKSGGIQDKEAPINYSNVALMCEACSNPTRVGFKLTQDGRKKRFCKKCGEMID